jgi:hypothetical protein
VKRDHNETVTDGVRLPLLIPATPEESEGLATFLTEIGPPKPVRTFKNSDLRNATKHLTKSDAQHFYAVIALTQALQNPPDVIALKNAKTAFDEWYKMQPGFGLLSILGDDEVSQELYEEMVWMSHLPPNEAAKFLEGKRPGRRASEDPRWLLSYQMSSKLSSARVVLWWTGERLAPAIWCDEMETAFYVRALLNVVGGQGFRICPHCTEPFLQRRSNQSYCSIAHREAHRVARWRTTKARQSRKKGGKRGSRKAR